MGKFAKLWLAVCALACSGPAAADCYRPKTASPPKSASYEEGREAMLAAIRAISTRCASTQWAARLGELLAADPEKEADAEAQAGRFLLRWAVVGYCGAPFPADTRAFGDVQCASLGSPSKLPLHAAPATFVVDAKDEDDHTCQSAIGFLLYDNALRYNRRLIKHAAYPNKDLCHVSKEPGEVAKLLGSAPPADQIPTGVADLPTAARFGLTDKVYELIDDRADPAHTDALGFTALEWAVMRGYEGVFERLVKLPATQRYCAALSAAIRYGRREMATKLAGRCIEPDLLPFLTATAAEAGYLDAVKLLVEQGVDLNFPTCKHYPTCKLWSAPLHHAALAGHPEVVRYLLDKGANPTTVLISIPNNKGKALTPLYYAIINGRGDAEVVRLLLEWGAPLNSCYEWRENGADMPALFWALGSASPDIVKVLVNHGAPVDGPANPEQEYQCAAKRWKEKVYTRRYLEPPIFSYLWHTTPQALDQLLALGANPNVLDSEGSTPLITAIMQNGTYEKLPSGGVYGAGKMPPRLIPGHEKAVHQGIEPVRRLLEHKADPNFRSKAGLAPLHHAARSEYCRDIAELLLANGADINIPDNDGRTPLDYAKELKLDRMIDFLTSKGARTGKT